MTLNPRNAWRQRLVGHLHAAGQRPVLEALIAVENGKPLDAVLADFGRLPISMYRAIGADELQIHRPLALISGGRK
jgi:hypothetical protein